MTQNSEHSLIFWVLLLVPALILSTAAFSLLSHEQERIQKNAVLALTDRGRSKFCVS
ncbi:MAG: hypothetical protein HUK40_05250 [Desulfobacter sp.]|nr:hypothetical protein [Desulfobacter sp.]